MSLILQIAEEEQTAVSLSFNPDIPDLTPDSVKLVAYGCPGKNMCQSWSSESRRNEVGKGVV